MTFAQSDEPVLAVNRDLYPDVADHGGLGPAWSDAARRAGVVLDGATGGGYHRLVDVVMDTAHGSVELHLVADQRLFSMLIVVDGRERLWGSMPDLEEAARAAATWRDGIGMRAMMAAFPWLRTDRIAQAREDGNLREVLWAIHLADPGYATLGPVLRAAHDDPRLSRLFPSVTHQTLVRFTVDDRDRSRGQVTIAYFPDHYEFESSWDETVRTAPTAEEAVGRAAAQIPDVG